MHARAHPSQKYNGPYYFRQAGKKNLVGTTIETLEYVHNLIVCAKRCCKAFIRVIIGKSTNTLDHEETMSLVYVSKMTVFKSNEDILFGFSLSKDIG